MNEPRSRHTPSSRPGRASGNGLEGLRQLRVGRRASPPVAAPEVPVAGAGLPVRSRQHGRRHPRARRWPRRILITANVVVALVLVSGGLAFGYARWRLGQIQRVGVPGLAASGTIPPGTSTKMSSIPPFTMLLIGSDTRSLGSGNKNNQFGSTTQVVGQRSDSIILVRVNPQARALGLLSIPRDTIVPIPGYGNTRINAAFNSGNPGLLVKVLSQDFGIQVNHVAEFNFNTFRAVSQAIGGVYQWFPTPARDLYSGLGVAAGCQLLIGNSALAFARSREYQYFLNGAWHYQKYPESDLGRIQRQQAFVKAAVKKALVVAPTNPAKLNSLVTGLTKNLTLDNKFSAGLIFGLVKDFRTANFSSVPSWVYATHNSTTVSGALAPDITLGTQQVHQWLDVGQSAPASGTKSTKATTPAPTTPPVSVAPSSVSIEVANGSGVSSQAAGAASALGALGYHATVNATYSNYTHAKTVIDYAPDALNDAKQLQSEIKGGATLVQSAALTPTVYNLELITGKSYKGVTAAAPAGTAPTTAPSAPTTTIPAQTNPAIVGDTTNINPQSSSVYHGQYVPPGRVPGQIPKSCPA